MSSLASTSSFSSSPSSTPDLKEAVGASLPSSVASEHGFQSIWDLPADTAIGAYEDCLRAWILNGFGEGESLAMARIHDPSAVATNQFFQDQKAKGISVPKGIGALEECPLLATLEVAINNNKLNLAYALINLKIPIDPNLLNYAIKQNQDLAVAMLAGNAEIDAISPRTKSPLVFTALSNPNVLEEMLKRAVRTDVIDSKGQTLLLAAIKEEATESATILINQRIGCQSTPPGAKETVLSVAIALKNQKIIGLLMDSDFLTTENAVDHHKYAVEAGLRELADQIAAKFPQQTKDLQVKKIKDDLQNAVAKGETEKLYRLLDLHPELINSQGSVFESNPTLLEIAAAKGRFDIVKELHSRGALLEPETSDFSPLLFAVRKGLRNITGTRQSKLPEEGDGQDHLAIVRYLVEQGVNIDKQDSFTNRDKNTALHLAVQGRDLEILTYLLDQGADPNIRNGWGRSPLMELCFYPGYNRPTDPDRYKIAALLIPKTNLALKDSSGFDYTALHLAIAHNENQLALELIRNQAPLDKLDYQGRGPLALLAYKHIDDREYDSPVNFYSLEKDASVAAEMLAQIKVEPTKVSQSELNSALASFRTRGAFTEVSQLCQLGAKVEEASTLESIQYAIQRFESAFFAWNFPTSENPRELGYFITKLEAVRDSGQFVGIDYEQHLNNWKTKLRKQAA